MQWLEALAQDVRYALRTLARNPGFATVAMLTLAPAASAPNTAIFSLVHAVLLRPLPFADPDRLAVVWADFTARGGPSTVQAAPADFVDWKAGNKVFADMAAMDGCCRPSTSPARGEPERLSGAKVTATVPAARPRADRGADAPAGRRPRRGGSGRPDQRGTVAPAVRRGASLVGATDQAQRRAAHHRRHHSGQFQFPTPGTDVWVPAAFTPEQLARAGVVFLNVLARLSPASR